jgi:hypothetical protein
VTRDRTPQAIAGDARRFNRHYALFRDARTQPAPFRSRHWLAIGIRHRIASTSTTAASSKTVSRLERDYGCDRIDDARWEEVKRHYIAS